MTTEWKLVPVEPTNEMYFAFCEARGVKGSTLKDGLRATIAAAAVPPAGDVEVLAVVTLGGYFSSEELGDIDIEPVMSALEQIQQDVVRSDSDEHVELVDRAHVTRLTAENARLQADFKAKFQDHKRELQKAWDERDALKAELADLADLKAYVTIPLRERCAQRIDLQSELTKARELLGKQEEFIDSAWQWLPIWLRKTYKLLAHQSAPAAKGGE